MADPYLVGGFTGKSLFTPAANLVSGFAGAVLGKDVFYGGTYRIIGTVKKKALPSNTPLARRVTLFRERDSIVIREVWSDASGNYAFNYIDGSETYFVKAKDHEGNFNAVIADNLTPEPM